MQRNLARQAAMKALEEDPTVFQYDEVYDDMQQKKEEKKPVKTEKKVLHTSLPVLCPPLSINILLLLLLAQIHCQLDAIS